MRAVLIALVLLAGCTPPAPSPPEAPPAAAAPEAAGDILADGRAIAEAQCAACHAVGPFGDSPRKDAPPLRTILEGEKPEAMKADFTEGLHMGHPDMPAFALNPQGVDALFAYVQSIQEK